MEYGFTGKVNSTKTVTRSTGNLDQLMVSTRLYELDLDTFFKFIAEEKINVHIDLGAKRVDTFECEMSSARTAKTKEGTFLYVTLQGPHYKAFSHLGNLTGQEVGVVLEMIAGEDGQQELEES